jgi:DNA-binding MarR family transcriptional regulator
MQADTLKRQAQEFLKHLDAMVDLLTPDRRPGDRAEPECSFSELRVLAALGRHEPVAMSALAATLHVPLSTATRTVDRLIAKDLVERSRVQTDRRIVQVGFSRRGKEINRFVVRRRLTIARRLLETLGPRERDLFITRMGKAAKAS